MHVCCIHLHIPFPIKAIWDKGSGHSPQGNCHPLSHRWNSKIVSGTTYFSSAAARRALPEVVPPADYLKKNSSEAQGKMSWPSVEYKTVFKKPLEVIWTYLWVGSIPSTEKTVFSELVIKNVKGLSCFSKFLFCSFTIFHFYLLQLPLTLSFLNFSPIRRTLVPSDLLFPSHCVTALYTDKVVHRAFPEMRGKLFRYITKIQLHFRQLLATSIPFNY